MSYIRDKKHAHSELTKLLIDTDISMEELINYLCNYYDTSELARLIEFIKDEQS